MLGPREVGTLRKSDIRQWLAEKLEGGASTELVNRIIRTLKATLFFALTDSEVLDRNIMLRFRPFEGVNPKASVAERVTARALGERPVLRVLENPNPPAVRQPLENSIAEQTISVQVTDLVAPPAGVEPTTYRLGGGRSIH